MVLGLKDIARKANVSLATVSKALRGRDDVSEETRQRVLAVADEMKYRPNLLVRGIQTGRTGNIGLMIPMGSDPFFALIMRGIHDEICKHDIVPMVQCVYRNQDGSWRGPSEAEVIHRLVDRRVDGIIIVPTEDEASDDYLHEIRDHCLPFVAIDRQLPNCHLADFVGSDDSMIGQLAAKHLLAMGHNSIAHIAGPGFASTARQRRTGFEQEIQQATVAYTAIEEPSFTTCGKATHEMLEDTMPSAVFCANDHLASSLYGIVAQKGLIPGKDIAILGVGDLPFAANMSPTLSSIRQFPREIGAKAAQLLLGKINQPPDERTCSSYFIPPKLVVRASTSR